MKSCKDCIHYVVCSDIAEKFIEAFASGINVTDICKNFKNKTQEEKMEDNKVYLEFTLPKCESPCMICGEPTPVEHGGVALKICDKCREAVMAVRETIGKAKEVK